MISARVNFQDYKPLKEPYNKRKRERIAARKTDQRMDNGYSHTEKPLK